MPRSRPSEAANRRLRLCTHSDALIGNKYYVLKTWVTRNFPDVVQIIIGQVTNVSRTLQFINKPLRGWIRTRKQPIMKNPAHLELGSISCCSCCSSRLAVAAVDSRRVFLSKKKCIRKLINAPETWDQLYSKQQQLVHFSIELLE